MRVISVCRYTHVEAECPFIDFDTLMSRIEDLVCDVVERVLSSAPGAALLHELNPQFKKPCRPFRRMHYVQAVDWLREHQYKKEDGSMYVFGEVCARKLARSSVC